MEKLINIIITILLLATGLILPVGCNKSSIPAEYIDNYLPVGSSWPQFEIAVPLPDMPEKAMIYRIKYPEITTGYVAGLGSKFDIEGDIRQGEDMFSICDDETGCTLEVFDSGAIWYSAEPSREILYNEEAELPSLEEAGKIVIDYLEDRELLPPDVKRFMRATKDQYGNFIRVTFSYTIGDYRATGPGYGYGYSVLVGDRGRIGKVSIYHPELEPYTEADIRLLEEAIDNLSDGKGYWATHGTGKIALYEVSLRYYFLPVIEKQEYVLPVYVFEGAGVNENGIDGDPAIAIVMAISP